MDIELLSQIAGKIINACSNKTRTLCPSLRPVLKKQNNKNDFSLLAECFPISTGKPSILCSFFFSSAQAVFLVQGSRDVLPSLDAHVVLFRGAFQNNLL